MFEGLFQPMHLVVILGIALLVFGPKKLPELGKGLGEAIRQAALQGMPMLGTCAGASTGSMKIVAITAIKISRIFIWVLSISRQSCLS